MAALTLIYFSSKQTGYVSFVFDQHSLGEHFLSVFFFLSVSLSAIVEFQIIILFLLASQDEILSDIF